MPTADTAITLAPLFDYSVGYAKTPEEFRFLLDRAIGLDFLETPHGEAQYRLTLNGWKRISELRESSAKANQAFVAMWFAREMDAVWSNGIKPALEQTSYIPLRIDRAEHNDKIDDRIIAEIRKSGLLIADFTGHRGGVYFEAGFALGLSIPVIWTCRDTDIESTHFDTRQYNHIVWKAPSDLKEKLIARIEATVPLQRHNT
jgi:nucleoside 2-deoxyribosyltransferase